MTAGSDCYRMGDYCRAGIITDILPNDTFQFAEILKSENYYVFCRNDRTYKQKYEESAIS